MMNLGKIEKLWLEAYSDNDFKPKNRVKDNPVQRFYALVNPESFKREYSVQYCSSKVPGTRMRQCYRGTDPENLTLNLLFDGTGIINNGGVSHLNGKNKYDVSEQIELLKRFCYDYSGKIHRPNYIKICWGSKDGLFKGILKSLSIDYKLFKPDGRPLRAEVGLVLESTESIKETLRREDNQSPDITHKRTVRAGDRFDLMVDEVYEDQEYYLDVAKANNLLSFRDIPIGQPIYFPPLQ